MDRIFLLMWHLLLICISKRYCILGQQIPGCTTCKDGDCTGNNTSWNCTHGCINGYYGNNCSGKCPYNCDVCDPNTEYFSMIECSKCTDGWYTSLEYLPFRCSRCATGCKACSKLTECNECNDRHYIFRYTDYTKCIPCNAGCINNTCDNKTGDCLGGCIEGYYGPQCDKMCTNCLHNTCDIKTGDCLGGCITGHYGHQCDQLCTNCLHSICNGTGHCVEGCKDGHYGVLCIECLPTCQACNSSDSCTRCKWNFGNRCENLCSENCKYNLCHIKTGHCTYGCKNRKVVGEKCDFCKDGYYGSACYGKCLPYCQTCNSNNTCVTCNPGWYGCMCQTRCPSGCLNHTCDMTNGKCLFGCQENSTGQWCDQTKQCLEGFYGNGCTESCPQHCVYGSCESNSGRCKLGCTTGFTGDFCDVKTEDISRIVVPIVTFFVTIGIGAVIYIARTFVYPRLIRKRNNVPNSNSNRVEYRGREDRVDVHEGGTELTTPSMDGDNDGIRYEFVNSPSNTTTSTHQEGNMATPPSEYEPLYGNTCSHKPYDRIRLPKMYENLRINT